MTPLEVMLKEYETLRREQAAALHHEHRLVSYGLVALALLGAGAVAILDAEPPPPLALGVLYYGMPVLASLILLLWVGQVDRGRRVSDYLVALEIDINDTLGKDALVWENYVRHRKLLKYPDIAVIVFWLGVTVGAPLLGQQAAGPWTLTTSLLVSWLLGAGVAVFVLIRFFRPKEWAAIPRERSPWEPDEVER